MADHPEGCSCGYFERHIFERPKLLVTGATAAQDRRLQKLVALLVEAKVLPQAVRRNRSIRHRPQFVVNFRENCIRHTFNVSAPLTMLWVTTLGHE